MLLGRTREHRIGVDVVPTAPESEADASAKEKAAARAKQEAAKLAGGVRVTSRGVKLPKLPVPRIKNPLAKLKLDATTIARLRSGDADAPPTERQVLFRQKPIIAWLVLVVLLLLLLAAYLLYTLLPRKVAVPNLIGARGAFVAEKRLRAAHLTLSQPVQQRRDPDVPPGSVIEQSPNPRTKVAKGDSVTIVLATGTSTVAVPQLAHVTRVNADAKLRAVGLALGDLQPTDAPDDWVVRSQIPAAGLAVARGTAVKVFLEKPPKTAKQKQAAAKAKAAAAAQAAAKAKAKAAEIKVPPISDRLVAIYSAALSKLGLRPNVVPVIGRPVGKVLVVDPKPGTVAKAGDTVTVRADAGFPPLAVQGRLGVLVLDPGQDGKQLLRLPPASGPGFEPAFVPGKQQIIYRSSDVRLVLAGTGKRPAPRELYAGPDVLEHPSVASDGQTIALIRREEGDGDLCFGNLSFSDLGYLCLPDDGWDLDGRISWSADGKVVLVPARRHDDPSAFFAIRRYEATHPFALTPEQWSGATATSVDVPGKGVIAAAFSPGGKKIAAVANLQTDRFEVVVSAVDDVALAQAKPLGVPACDLAWRPDGLELAVVQSDPGCTKPVGNVVRFALASPATTAPVRTDSSYPSYGELG